MKLYAVALGLSLSACAISEPTEDDIEVSEVEQGLMPQCDEPGCGLNSPEIANYNFWDLSLNYNTYNTQGFRITSFEKNGVPYTLSVSGGRIKGVRRDGVLSGQALVGATIHVEHQSDLEFVIVINAVQQWSFWAKTGSSTTARAEGYELLWRQLGTATHYENVCSDPPVRGIDTLYTASHLTFVFEGERISQETKTIASTLDTRWFNLGCAGSTLAKLHLTGHTYAASLATNRAFSTTIPERQTMLKMLSADYCGTGKAFTIQGTPLDWADDKNWMEYAYSTQNVEARWNADGAVCLNRPRVLVNPIGTTGTEWLPSIVQDIAVECRTAGHPLPPCPDQAEEPGAFHLTSANPY